MMQMWGSALFLCSCIICFSCENKMFNENARENWACLFYWDSIALELILGWKTLVLKQNFRITVDRWKLIVTSMFTEPTPSHLVWLLPEFEFHACLNCAIYWLQCQAPLMVNTFKCQEMRGSLELETYYVRFLVDAPKEFLPKKY